MEERLAILGLSHVELRVSDLELATAYYVEVLGLVEVESDAGRTHLKCWDEHHHHSLALVHGPGSGVEHVAFEVEAEDDLERFAAAAAAHGCAVRRVPAGAEPGHGPAVRVMAPSGHDVELVWAMERTGNLLSRVNPAPEPDGLRGVHPLRLDRVQLTAEDVGRATAFFAGVLGFRVTERLVAAGGEVRGTWMERSRTPCDVAVVRGPNAGLHHLGFRVDDWDAVRRAADVLAANGIPIEAGPTRQGVTRSLGVQCVDPLGVRVHVLTGGYRSDPGQEPVTWTESEMGRAMCPYQGGAGARPTAVG